MNCYVMKALTLNGDWHTFTMEDLPVAVSDKEFVLIGKQGSPRLRLDTIRRGDLESSLFEGDIFVAEGMTWMTCYERGFYAISTEYNIRYLYTFNDFEISDMSYEDFPVPISFREKNLFKFKDTIFRLEEIVGCYKGAILLRCISNTVYVEDIQQECCLTYKGKRVYLGDVIEGAKVEIHGGRITLCKNDTIVDIITGGELDGYNTWRFRRS